MSVYLSVIDQSIYWGFFFLKTGCMLAQVSMQSIRDAKDKSSIAFS